MSVEEFKTSGHEYGLTKIMDQGIKEVHGYISTEFGDPTFKMTGIELEDGTMITCEGEHDCPYLAYNDHLDLICSQIHDEETEEEESEEGSDEGPSEEKDEE